MHPKVLISTSAGDMGVDHFDAQLVLNFEFPEDPSTVIQRRGWASRGGKDVLFVLDAGLSSYLNLVRRIGDNRPCCSNDKHEGNVDGFNNSEIAIPTKATAAERVKERIEAKYALSEKTLCKLRKQ